MDQFPPNSRKARDATQGPKRVERVTSANAVRRKKSLSKQFSGTFLGGDARTAGQYVIFNVIIPAAKEMMVEAGSAVIERIVYGDHRPRGRGPMAQGLGHVAYNRMGPARPSQPQPALSQRARSTFAFEEIIINSRQEAEEVIDQMYDILDKYESVSVADLYSLTGIESSHTDLKWGWTDLRGAAVGRVRGGGYLLDLPEPEFLA